MSHILDRPVWNALATRHADLAQGDARARRYPPTIIPFGAPSDAGADSLESLIDLLRPGESVLLVETGSIALPSSAPVIETGSVVQMILVEPPAPAADARIEKLAQADAPEMLALAEMTHPGPFTLGAQVLGSFYGIRIAGRLVAMAGVRMRQQDGTEHFTEVSGVCTHPDFRGRGLARSLTSFMVQRFIADGEVPYLHTYSSNEAAIGLYQSMGFALRTELNIARIGAR